MLVVDTLGAACWGLGLRWNGLVPAHPTDARSDWDLEKICRPGQLLWVFFLTLPILFYILNSVIRNAYTYIPASCMSVLTLITLIKITLVITCSCSLEGRKLQLGPKRIKGQL